jgi:23S rRNA pseudouridine2605 synthase/23S rRNA pseudouridine2604 synthase
MAGIKNTAMIRINKYIAENSGLSRRDADKVLEEGRVTLNGEAPEGPWVKVGDSDVVAIDGKELIEKELFYWKFYKPVNVLTAYGDGHGKDTLDIYPELRDKKPAYSGRLDYESEGLIIFSNDGDFIQRLQKSDNKVEKEYIVDSNNPLTDAQLRELRNGITYEGINYLPCRITYHSRCRYIITLHEGKKRQIRNMFRHCELRVRKLKRVRIGSLNLNEMKRGELAPFSPKEMREMVKN